MHHKRHKIKLYIVVAKSYFYHSVISLWYGDSYFSTFHNLSDLID